MCGLAAVEALIDGRSASHQELAHVSPHIGVVDFGLITDGEVGPHPYRGI